METRRELPIEHLAIREIITSELVHRDNLKRMLDVISSPEFQKHFNPNGEYMQILQGIIAGTESLLNELYNQAPWNFEIETRKIAVMETLPGQTEPVIRDKDRVFAVNPDHDIDRLVERMMNNPQELGAMVADTARFAQAIQPVLARAINITDQTSPAGVELNAVISRLLSASEDKALPDLLSAYSNGVNPIYIVQRGPRYKMKLEELQGLATKKEARQCLVESLDSINATLDNVGAVTKRTNDIFGKYTHLIKLDQGGFDAVFRGAMQPELFTNQATFGNLLQEHQDLQNILVAPDTQIDPVVRQEISKEVKDAQEIIVDAIKACVSGANKAADLDDLSRRLDAKIQIEADRNRLRAQTGGGKEKDRLSMQRQSVDMILRNTLDKVRSIFKDELNPPQVVAQARKSSVAHPAKKPVGQIESLRDALDAPINDVLNQASFSDPLLEILQAKVVGIIQHSHFDKILGSKKPVVELLGRFIKALEGRPTKEAKEEVRQLAIRLNISHGDITMKQLFVAAIAESVSKQVMSKTDTSDVLSAIMFGGKDICVELAKDTSRLSDIKITPMQSAQDLFNYDSRIDDAKKAASAKKSLESKVVKVAADKAVPETVNELMFLVPDYSAKTTLGRKSIKQDIEREAKTAEEGVISSRIQRETRQPSWKKATDARRGSTGSFLALRKQQPGKQMSDPTSQSSSREAPPPSLQAPESEPKTPENTPAASDKRLESPGKRPLPPNPNRMFSPGQQSRIDEQKRLAEEARERQLKGSKPPSPGNKKNDK